jgi:hypothetical protein
MIKSVSELVLFNSSLSYITSMQVFNAVFEMQLIEFDNRHSAVNRSSLSLSFRVVL